jgi:hypothetical protein
MSESGGARALVAAIVLSVCAGCSTYVGDRLLKVPEEYAEHEDAVTIVRVLERVRELVARLNLPEERAAVLITLSPTAVVHGQNPLDLDFMEHRLILAAADSKVAFARDSVILAAGSLHISHSGNNVIIGGGDVDISHDGSFGRGSLVVARGRIAISHASNTLVYAPGGVDISHARDVWAFNTPDGGASRGDIRNLAVKPLFREEAASGRGP